MCIIVCKNKGVELPSREIFKECFASNPDGAGIMWYNPYKKKVIIDKGYMSYDSFDKHLEHLEHKYKLTDIAMVFHFRIGTDGVKRNPANTHPFPIKRDLEMLTKSYMEVSVGVAHNGIISNYRGTDVYSDTQMFISTFLYDLYKTNDKFYRNENLKHSIKLLSGSKFAFLDDTNTITTIGDFIEDNGILYSNNSYIPYVPPKYVTPKYYGYYDYDYIYDYSNEAGNHPKKDIVKKENPAYTKPVPVGMGIYLDNQEWIDVEEGDNYAISKFGGVYQNGSYIGVSDYIFDKFGNEQELF